MYQLALPFFDRSVLARVKRILKYRTEGFCGDQARVVQVAGLDICFGDVSDLRESLVDLAVLKIEDMSALEFDLVAGISRYSRNWITSVTVKYFTHRHPKDVVALASSYTGQALIATSYYIHFYVYSSVPVLTRLESSIGRKCKKHFTSTLVTWRTIPYICISPQLTTEDITPCMHHIIYHL